VGRGGVNGIHEPRLRDGERVIDAAARCGGAQRVQEIRTERSFVQRLIATIAGYYINIYSPYTGEVVCVGRRRE